MRFQTQATSDKYVAGKLWQFATLERCPWHPQGGCGFSRHGTYSRVRATGTLIARWYCPQARRTVSALPDCLASHYSGTLNDLEAQVLALERAPSRLVAAEQLRTEIELPGALRYLDRLRHAVHSALAAIRGLEPECFAHLVPTLQAFSEALGADSLLMRLRERFARYLPQLPTPFGFNPHRRKPGAAVRRRQHTMGADPPSAIIKASPPGRSAPDFRESP